MPPSPRGPDWAFKHMLIRDVAYESMPRAASARTCTSSWPGGWSGRADGDRQAIAGALRRRGALGD